MKQEMRLTPLSTYSSVGLQSLNHQWSSQDDIFIDDDGAALEGSGAGHHEVKDDLESSGSGYGPDDEDGDGGSGDIILPSEFCSRPVVPCIF
uniref:Uncharacterized protein n=1 Tax=Timema genevievae TaxID=629358 RepID=A0A7R9JXD9_TIMGE|nr:unnamed protein product [Timema genevievae]